MPIKVRCPSCKKVLTAPDAARGKAVRCSGCQGVVKIPANATPSEAVKKREKPLDESTDLLLSIRAMDAVDKDSKVCPKCGADMEEEQTECHVCGIDITTGELGQTAQRARKKGIDSGDFSKFVWSDAKKFVSKNKNLMFQTMRVTFFRLVVTILVFLLYLWCYRIPPKFLAGFVTTVSILSMLGWPWFLYLKVVDAALDKKDRLKRVHGDYFANVALGVKFLLWCVAFGLPMVLLGFVILWVFSASGQALIGTIVAAFCLLFIYLPFPIAMAHMAMPVQNAAWLIPKMFPLFFRLLKPTLYLWLVLLTVNLPVIGGIAAVGAVYAPQANQMIAEIEEQNDKLRAAFNYSLAPKSDDLDVEPVDPPEPKPWPSLMPMVVPVSILCACSIYWGFSCVFSIRAMSLYVVALKRSLDLETDAPEIVFKGRSSTPTRKVRPIPHPTLNGILVLLGMAIYPVLGAYVGALEGKFEDPRIGMALGGMIGLSVILSASGKWVAFQKFGVPGFFSIIPIFNAQTIMKMAGWESKYLLAFVFFPWIRRSVMYDLAERWGMDKQAFGIGLTAFPFAYWPMLGWSPHLHTDCYVPKEWDPRGGLQKFQHSEDKE